MHVWQQANMICRYYGYVEILSTGFFGVIIQNSDGWNSNIGDAGPISAFDSADAFYYSALADVVSSPSPPSSRAPRVGGGAFLR
jgi:hypothetical protein